jgi:hypothetical protein
MQKQLLQALLATGVYANTSIVSTQSTSQQILMTVATDQPGYCTYRASEGASAGAMVADVDPALFPGANSDARSGSLVNGGRHAFALGTRKAQKASNNKWSSRSLQTNTVHWIGVTCGGDAEVSTVASTSNPPLGKTWAEAYPYDATAPLGYAWPTIDFANKSRSYIDPQTGILVKRLTGLDSAPETAAPSNPTHPAVAGGGFAPQGGWGNPQSGALVDAAVAVSSGTQPLFVAFSPFSINFSLFRAQTWETGVAYASITDIKVRVTGLGTAGANNAAVCLTVNGVTCATEQRTITIPAANGTVNYPPGIMTPYFSEWIGTTITTPPATYDMATLTGTVNVSGTAVSLVGGNSFNVEAWSTGSHIKIAAASGCSGGDYTISSVNSASSLTLTTSAGACSGATYTGYNFGLLLFPQNSAVLSIDGVGYTWDERSMSENPSNGMSFYCNPTKVTPAGGTPGHLCLLPNTGGALSGHFVEDNLGDAGAQSVHIFSAAVPSNPDKTINYGVFPQDQTLGATLRTYTSSIPSDPSNPNVFYALALNPSFTKFSLIKGTYVPGGTGGTCTDVSNYQAYVPVGQTGQNCNIVWKTATRASAEGTLTDRLAAFDSRFDPAYFGNVAIVGMRKDYLVIAAYTSQDLLGWLAFVDTVNFNVVAMWNSYTNFPLRWAGVHGYYDAGDATTAIMSAGQNLSGCGINGCGPYEVTVTAINGVAGTSMPAVAAGSCAGVTDSRVVNLLSRGNGCDVVTLSGLDACDSSPSAYEQANFPLCSWNAAYRGLKLTSPVLGAGQQVDIGDAAIDPACGPGISGCEQFLIVQKMGGDEIKVLRNFGLAHGIQLSDPKLSTIRTHTANFTLRMAAGTAATDCYTWGHFLADPHGTSLQCDATYYPTSHADFYGNTSVVSNYFPVPNEIGYSIRSGRPPFSSQLNQPHSLGVGALGSTNTGIRFEGVLGSGHHLNAIVDSHPSNRQVTAPLNEQRWFLDVVRLNSFFGDLYNGAATTPITGSLYRIAGFQLSGSVNLRSRPLLVWSGRHNMQDMSGPGSSLGGGSSDHWKYCVALTAGECDAGSTPGQVYVNVPSATANGKCTALPYANTLCVTPASRRSGFSIPPRTEKRRARLQSRSGPGR